MAKSQITLEWIIEKYLSYFQTFHLTEDALRTYYSQFKSLLPTASDGDFLWHVFQLIVKEIAKQSHSEEQLYRLNEGVYLKMWEYLVTVENKNGNHVMRLHNENQLRLWQLQFQLKFKWHIVIISGHCCPYCDSLDEKELTFEEALEQQPLASKHCTRELGCNCCYVTRASRDANGRLIKL
jgi:hypothetical protein